MQNFTETAPETWEGGYYDEKADIFSFGIILWSLFGSTQQNRDTESIGEIIESVTHEESAYLRSRDKILPPFQQREIIRKVINNSNTNACYKNSVNFFVERGEDYLFMAIPQILWLNLSKSVGKHSLILDLPFRRF